MKNLINLTQTKPSGLARLLHCLTSKHTQTMNWIYRYRHVLMTSAVVAVVIAVLFAPEQVLAEPLEGQLDKFNNIMVDKVKKYGISSATIAGGIWSLFKGNIKLTGLIIAIGVALSFFLKWVEGGMVI